MSSDGRTHDTASGPNGVPRAVARSLVRTIDCGVACNRLARTNAVAGLDGAALVGESVTEVTRRSLHAMLTPEDVTEPSDNAVDNTLKRSVDETMALAEVGLAGPPEALARDLAASADALDTGLRIQRAVLHATAASLFGELEPTEDGREPVRIDLE